MKPRALIVIPETVNYFYNLSGHRVAEALRELGVEVVVHPLQGCPKQEFDLCILSNISELIAAAGNETVGLEQIEKLRQRSGHLGCLSIDSVSTNWFNAQWDLCERAGVEMILDLGLEDQTRYLARPQQRAKYRFVLSGLTSSEQRLGQRALGNDAGRKIPWAFVGHNTPFRAALVDFLLQRVDPQGLVYMPELTRYEEKGSPHLNQQQYEHVLERSRYQIWCSHHHHVYMEPERFRTSFLTGNVPIKIIGADDDIGHDVPFRYLMPPPEDLVAGVFSQDFQELRSRFRREWQHLPTLTSEFARVLAENDLGMLRSFRSAA